MLVSIVIPAYNTKDYILGTLSSLEHQTYQDFEVIIVDDGSTDGTSGILDDYAQSHPQVTVIHQKNRGVSYSRNQGILRAKGEFISFLDSDDKYDPTFLEKMVKRQQETNGNIIYCGYNKIGNWKAEKPVTPLFKEGNVIRYFLNRQGYFHFSGMLIRKSLILQHKLFFDESKRISEDMLFAIQVLNSDHVYCVKENLFNYYYRASSAMNANWDTTHWITDLDTKKAMYHYFEQHYHHSDRDIVLKLALLKVFKSELIFFKARLKKGDYSSVINYLKNDPFSIHTKLSYRLFEQEKWTAILHSKNAFIGQLAWTIACPYFTFFKQKK